MNNKIINKNTLVDRIHTQLKSNTNNGLLSSKLNIKKIVDLFLDSITDALKNSEEVSLLAFGKFITHKTAAREIKSVKNRFETIKVESKINPKFKASSVFKKTINEAHK